MMSDVGVTRAEKRKLRKTLMRHCLRIALPDSRWAKFRPTRTTGMRKPRPNARMIRMTNER